MTICAYFTTERDRGVKNQGLKMWLRNKWISDTNLLSDSSEEAAEGGDDAIEAG